jgi:endonuclease YncB( thermonuclease family)
MTSNNLIPALIVGFMASAALASLYGLLSSRISTSKTTFWYSEEVIYVVDGDTLKIGEDRYRLSGFDTPETIQAKCDSERDLGERAKRRLGALIAEYGGIELWVKSRKDYYGRFIASGSVDGRDVGHILIAEGLARPYFVGPRSSWCPPVHEPQNEGNRS